MGKTPDASREAMLIRRAKSGVASVRCKAESTLITAFEEELATLIRSSRTASGLPFDDAIQAARYGLLQAIRRFDPDANTRLWTYARPFVISQLARDARASASSGCDLLASAELPDQAPELSAAEDRVTCISVLSRLSARERFVLLARYVMGIRGRTIAKRLAISPAAVSMIERRAVERLVAKSLGAAA